MTAKEFNKKIVIMSDKLYRFAYRYLQDADQTQDAIQDVFVKLWNKRDKLNELDSVEGFAIRVTRNHCLDVIKARRTVSLDDNDYYSNTISDGNDPEKEFNKSDSYEKMKSIIEKLSEPHRTVIIMKDIEGYSNVEIGKVLGLSEGNVRVVLSRARKKVRLKIEKIYLDENTKNENIIGQIL
jgi:RNA polymerase sigma-70 factor (ECF subfamily)